MITNSGDAMSAVVYTRLYRPNHPLEFDTIEDNDSSVDGDVHPWLALVKSELTNEDWLTVKNSTDIVVELALADETRALKVARLIRNGYQINGIGTSVAHLIIAVVMFEAEPIPSGVFVQTAKQLAVNENLSSGNKILLQYKGSNKDRLH